MCAELIPMPVTSNPDLLKTLASTALATVGQEDPSAALCKLYGTTHLASPSVPAMAMLSKWVAAPKLLLILMFQSLYLKQPCKEDFFVAAAFRIASDHLNQSKACQSLYQAKEELLIVL